MVTAGKLGVKTGEGFYSYTEGSKDLVVSKQFKKASELKIQYSNRKNFQCSTLNIQFSTSGRRGCCPINPRL